LRTNVPAHGDSAVKALVTGVSGFIGSNLAAELLGGYHASGLDNFSQGTTLNLAGIAEHPAFTLHRGDVRDLETVTSAPGSENVARAAAAVDGSQTRYCSRWPGVRGAVKFWRPPAATQSNSPHSRLGRSSLGLPSPRR
jgi:GDP-mannose 4,6 dehydratase